jgi:predicted kinase
MKLSTIILRDTISLTMQKLIFLNGPAGIGKSTIAQKYIDEHPLAISINGDDIIVMIGQWLAHEEEARKYMFELTKSMTDTYLRTGYDVLLPYLLVHPEQADAFEAIVKSHGAKFYEVVLFADKEASIERLMERGTWGEAGVPPLTEKDKPIIEELYDNMETALHYRPNTIKINSIKNDIDGTYRQFLEAIS